MKIFSTIGDKVWRFDRVEQNDDMALYENDTQIKYNFKSLGNNRYILIINDHSHLIHVIKENGIYHIHLDGDYFPVRVEDQQTRDLRALVEHSSQASGEQKIYAPIPGLITRIKVKEGDSIKENDGVVILEAMKMENEIKSETAGTIRKILVKEGMPVEKDQELIIIE
jgi:biotin carboxyl carrier protein